MTHPNFTTTAPETATEPRHLDVKHLFWEEDGRLAIELQIDVPYLCGTWGSPPTTPSEMALVDWFQHDDGAHTSLPRFDDCSACCVFLARFEARFGGR